MSIATLISGGLGSFGNIATLLEDGLAQYTGLPQPPLSGISMRPTGLVRRIRAVEIHSSKAHPLPMWPAMSA